MSSDLFLYKRDLADVTMGAEVVLALTSPASTEKASILRFADEKRRQRRAAELVFRGRHDNDSRCWEIEGRTGTIAVRLSEVSVPSLIAIYHSIHNASSPRADTTPRLVTVWALDLAQDSPAMDPYRRPILDFIISGRSVPNDIKHQGVIKLLDFELAQRSRVPVQIFPVPVSLRTNLIIVQLRDNWGGERTCIHRIGVY
ncbi:hypothetical protein R3P38DRAFT_2779665 [Favolaschia claudopus]|uniref:SUN domain-containing protein n=1 Tax=Favolaschia claudopus TaxID=2862362 RepID=A0AAW0BF11_9AGAR